MALFFTTFYFSTLYHGVQYAQAKRTLEILDHISIYFLIAGTTPLMYMPNSFGITLLVVYGVLQHWELFIRFFS
jgi:hemolysin III